MLKHMLTCDCPNHCSYCITKNVKIPQVVDFGKLKEVYAYLSGVHKQIMLTGGEPTAAREWRRISEWALTYFDEVYITTMNRAAIGEGSSFNAFHGITFSLHGDPPTDVLRRHVPVFASIMADEYSERLLRRLIRCGFAGLIISEDQRGVEPFTQHVPEIVEFPIKINRRGSCLDYPVIMPDLTVVGQFASFI